MTIQNKKNIPPRTNAPSPTPHVHKKKIKPRINKPKTKRTLKNEAKSAWKQKYLEKVVLCHKRNLDSVIVKLLAKGTNVRSSMIARSKKIGVKFELDIEEVREMIYHAYGSPCKYCSRQLTIKNMVFDHTFPISKGGESIRENLQIICKACNCVKGSLDETELSLLLEWVETVPETLKKDLMIRLARGIH